VSFSTPFLVLSGGFSLLYVFVPARIGRRRRRPLPPYPAPGTREDLFLILGERRGLYTGMVIVGAIGAGKTSACMDLYVEQLLAYRATDPTQQLGG
jgi:hypothetical protein